VPLGEIGLPLATPGKLIKDAAAEGNGGGEELPFTGDRLDPDPDRGGGPALYRALGR
jgi:hypothetical protein